MSLPPRLEFPAQTIRMGPTNQVVAKIRYSCINYPPPPPPRQIMVTTSLGHPNLNNVRKKFVRSFVNARP
jgi:hypothetical protein